MARIAPIAFEEADPLAQAAWEQQVADHGRMTNMKRTLARSGVALRTYMMWYDLQAELEKSLGKRLTLLFAHAISAETDCLICSTYFRRYFLDAGEQPEALQLDEKEQAFVDLGRQIAKDPRRVSEVLFQAIEQYLGPDEIVTLTAFAGMMVATNLLNHVLHVDLDAYLEGYRRREKA